MKKILLLGLCVITLLAAGCTKKSSANQDAATTENSEIVTMPAGTDTAIETTGSDIEMVTEITGTELEIAALYNEFLTDESRVAITRRFSATKSDRLENAYFCLSEDGIFMCYYGVYDSDTTQRVGTWSKDGSIYILKEVNGAVFYFNECEGGIAYIADGSGQLYGEDALTDGEILKEDTDAYRKECEESIEHIKNTESK